ncbi:MAG: hypothetical protein KGM15_17285 [Pseudomonadota bacterium]|nr:hypothetical protein [Pseudomonadota bacterium]
MKLISLALAAGVAVAAPAPKPVKLALKAGQAIAFPAAIVEGKVVLGPARLGVFGKMEPRPGEIAVGLSTRDKDLYDRLVVVEKTAAPIDFVATGMVGEIKIDERVLHGRLDAPVTQRIGGTSWTVVLREFEVAAAAGK